MKAATILGWYRRAVILPGIVDRVQLAENIYKRSSPLREHWVTCETAKIRRMTSACISPVRTELATLLFNAGEGGHCPLSYVRKTIVESEGTAPFQMLHQGWYRGVRWAEIFRHRYFSGYSLTGSITTSLGGGLGVTIKPTRWWIDCYLNTPVFVDTGDSDIE